MASRRHLQNPPIQEAILDVVFVGSQLDKAGLDRLAGLFPEGKWRRDKITETVFETKIDSAGQAAQPTAVSSFGGYSLRELDGHRIVQLREDRLTCSHVGKYSTWEDLSADFEDAFKKFVNEGRPRQVGRLATRFVNRIPLSDTFERLLTIPPQVLPNLGGASVTDFLRRQLIQGLRGAFRANLNVATVMPLPDEEHKALLIDIDVYKEPDLEPSFDAFRSELDVMRDIKNAIFFDSVTDKALEPFL